MCLSCLQFFQLPEMVGDFSTHLLTEHHIMIDGMDIIVDLKRYIEHWRQQLYKRSIEDIFPKICPKEGDEHFGKVDFYYLMNENVKEGKIIFCDNFLSNPIFRLRFAPAFGDASTRGSIGLPAA